MARRRIIGLTGGIACGKSTVSDYLAARYNLRVLDADLYARQAVAIDSPILQRIFDRYGETVRNQDRSLNRKKLGAIIFTDADEKRWVENQIHPYVRDRFARDSEKISSNTIVYSIPLLFEAKLTELVTEIWTVFCPRDEQIRRLFQRDGLSEEEAIARIENQMPIEEKIALADIALENSGSIEDLYRQIDRAIELSANSTFSSTTL